MPKKGKPAPISPTSINNNVLDSDNKVEISEELLSQEIPDMTEISSSAKEGKKEVTESKDYWSAQEHELIGSRAFKQALELPNLSKTADLLRNKGYLVQELIEDKQVTKLKLSKDLQLTAGEIIALAGDYYGAEHQQPVSCNLNSSEGKISYSSESEMRGKFESACMSLYSAKQEEIKRFKGEIAKGMEKTREAIKKGIKPSALLDNHGWFSAAVDTLKQNKVSGTYSNLLLNNFDHFEKEARKAYEIGHKIAIETATKARKDNSLELLMAAFYQELFACHFLTDLFSAGHVRTPRKALYEYALERKTPQALFVAGALANSMHDEDNSQGVNTHNKSGQATTVFGDNYLLDPADRDNLKDVINAVQSSLENIYNAYSSLAFNEHAYLDFLPKANSLEQDQTQKPPLFKVVKTRDPETNKIISKTVLLRTEDSRGQISYQGDWSPAKTMLQLRLKSSSKDPTSKILTAEEQKELQKIVEEEQTSLPMKK